MSLIFLNLPRIEFNALPQQPSTCRHSRATINRIRKVVACAKIFRLIIRRNADRRWGARTKKQEERLTWRMVAGKKNCFCPSLSSWTNASKYLPTYLTIRFSNASCMNFSHATLSTLQFVLFVFISRPERATFNRPQHCPSFRTFSYKLFILIIV